MTPRKILVVDDEESNVRLLSMSLRSDGYITIPAYSGEEGLEGFKKESPDIVITDIKMPGMDGLELLKKIKEIDSEKEVIIITGHGDIDSTIMALQYGASDFINKPVRDEALAIALTRAESKIDIRKKLNEYTENLENKIKEATTEIRRKSDFQKLLIKSSNNGIVATDNSWKIVIFNPEAERLFQQKQSDVINKIDIKALYPDEIIEALELETEMHKNGRLPWKETTLFSKNGKEIPISFSGNILYEKDKIIGSVSFFQDLTDIKKLEKELIQSERLVAVGQTVSGLAHYIKNILVGLKGGSYVLDVGLKNNNTEKLRAGWNTIKKHINRTSNLVQDLLTYSKERDPEYQKCSPNEVINEVIQLVENVAEKNDIKIKKKLDSAIGEVLIDNKTIHRSLLNLVSNAMDACLDDEDTNKNWFVSIKTSVEKNKIFCLEVEDNGRGMHQETMDNLYTSFFSTKGGRGTGLGLLVTKKLIQEHNGTIDFKSNLNKGTTFTIRLPFKDIIE
ncbi:MAG: histidine kinase [Desulfobacteraceae bacterium 4572_130]|nr:MAG: histidine kinase [Desulfobacteraceae bacterium 4572_130]